MNGVGISKLGKSDIDKFTGLIRLFEEVFEMKGLIMPDKKHLQKLLGDDNFIVFIAQSGGKVVGGLTAYVLQQYYSTSSLAYIYDLAVKTNFQRKGIGKMIIAATNDYCRKAGIEEIFVQADEIDTYALDFYRSTGGVAEKVVHFTYPLNSK